MEVLKVLKFVSDNFKYMTHQNIERSEISFKSFSGASTSLEWNATLFISTAKSLFSFNSGAAPRTLV